MLSREENQLITQVGPGTPMGELWRRFWLPALTSEELGEPDGAPVRTRLLGEDLVAFRDTNGTPGVFEAFCPHRRAPMFFGRNEECGLRCVYHGWKFDVDGTFVDMPSEPADSDFKEKVRIGSYPAREWGGFIWVFMGPPEKLPDLPQLEWALVPPQRRRVTKWIQECNWLQGVEGDIDTAHISFLHSDQSRPPDPAFANSPTRLAEKSPKLTALDTEYGIVYGGRRQMPNGDYYWRVTQWAMPMYAFIPQGRGACTAWLPVDDHHCIRYNVGYNPEQDLPVRTIEDPLVSVPTRRGMFTFPDGAIMDTYIPLANKANLYDMDRDWQKRGHYTGIASIPSQDRAMTEGMGYICDRSKEHLASTDLAIIATRRKLLRLARELEQGIEPYAASHPELFRVRALNTVSPEPTLEKLLEQNKDYVRFAATAV